MKVNSIECEVVDVNGAGDNFFSTFYYSICKHRDPQKSLRLATIAGKMSVTSKNLVSSDFNYISLMNQYNRFYINNDN